MINELAVERANNRKGTRISFIVHVGILLLAFLMTCNYEKVVDNQFAVALNFEEIIPPKLEEMTNASNSNKASEAEGKQREKADKPEEIKDQETKTVEIDRPEIKLPKVTPAPPTPTDPVISETTMEDETDVTAAEEDFEFEDLEPEDVPNPEPVKVEKPAETKEDKGKESIKTKIGKILDVFKSGGSDDKGNPKGDPSRGDGSKDGTGEGNKGTGAGKDASGNDGDSGNGTGGAGTGQYDGSGNGIFGRRVIKRNINEVLSAGFANQENKRIVTKVCVGKSGNVTYVEFIDRETTAVLSNKQAKIVLNGIYGYKYEANPLAPDQECGKLTIVIQNIKTLLPE